MFGILGITVGWQSRTYFLKGSFLLVWGPLCAPFFMTCSKIKFLMRG